MRTLLFIALFITSIAQAGFIQITQWTDGNQIINIQNTNSFIAVSSDSLVIRISDIMSFSSKPIAMHEEEIQSGPHTIKTTRFLLENGRIVTIGTSSTMRSFVEISGINGLFFLKLP